MGGYNSGRRGGKNCTDDMRQVDVRSLQRAGCLKPGMAYGWQWTRHGETVASINLSVQADSVMFAYQYRTGSGNWQHVRRSARLDRTPCNYGGTRVWWRCPNCARRVAILYINPTPACRHCYRLAYRCEREGTDDRATRQADKLRDRLGWEPGILNGNGIKPKGMHWRTFERLQARHDALVLVSFTEMNAKLGRMQLRLDNARRRLRASVQASPANLRESRQNRG